MSEAWLNSPCTDPLGHVFARYGRIFRALFRESAAQALETLDHPVLQTLMRDGLVARMSRSDLEVDGYGPVLEAEKFFFSSRRRHTRFDCDWSSDVCSSDLGGVRGSPHNKFNKPCSKGYAEILT